MGSPAGRGTEPGRGGARPTGDDDILSTGLAHAPNPEHSPFGTAQYHLEHLVGPWYTFEASDDY